MGYSVDLTGWSVTCKSEDDAIKAAALVNGNEHTVYHLTAKAEGTSLEYDDYQSDHWHDADMLRLFAMIAPHIESGEATFRGQEGEEFRIRWQGGSVYQDFAAPTVWEDGDPFTLEDLDAQARAQEERQRLADQARRAAMPKASDLRVFVGAEPNDPVGLVGTVKDAVLVAWRKSHGTLQ